MESSLGLRQNLEPDRESEANPEGQSSTEETIGDMTESEDVTYFQHVLLKELFYETRGSHIPQVCSVRNQPDDSATSSANASSNQCHEEKEKLPSKIECDLYSYLLPYFASKVGEMKTPFVNLQAKIADCEELQLVFSYKDKKAVKNIIQVYKELVKNLIIREIVFDVKSDRDLFKFIERKNCSRGWGTNNSHVYISTCAIEEGKVSVFGFDDKSINEAQQWLKSHVSDSGITARTLSVLVQQPLNKEKKYKINQREKKQKRLELSAISLEIDSKNCTERRGIEAMSVAERKILTEENRKMKSMPDHQIERDSEAILSITESDLCADNSLENSDQVFLEAVVIANHYWIMDFGTRELKRACDRNHVKVIESEYSSGKAKIILKGTLIDLLAVQKALDDHAKMITDEIECSANSAKSKEVISEQADEKENLANKKVTENASKGARRKEYKTFHADESNHNELGNLEPSSLPFINNNDKNSEERVTSETFEDTTGHSTAQSNSAQGNSGDKNFAESNRIKEIERRNSNSNHSDEDHENSSSGFSGQQSDNRSSVSVHGKKDVKTQIPISEQPRKRFADDSQLSGNLSGRYDGNPFNDSSDQIKSLEGTRYCHRSGVMTADVTNTIRENNSADKSQEDSKLKGDGSVSPRDAKLELRSERNLEGSGAGVMEVHSPPPLAKSESDLSGSESASDSEDMTNKMHKSNKSSLPSEESKGAEDEESEKNKKEKLTGMQPLQSDGDSDNEATTGNATNTNFQSDPVEKLSGDMQSQKLNTEKTAVPVAKERKKRKVVKEMMSGARVEDQEAGDDINVVSDNINLKKPEQIDLQKTIKITKSKKDLLKQQTNSENDKNSNDKTKAEDGVDNDDQTANRNDSQYFQNSSEVNKDYRHNSTGEINQNLEELENQKRMDSASHPAGHENMEVDSDGFVVANSNRDGTDTAEDDGKVTAKKEEVKPGNVGRYNSRGKLQGTLDERRELDNAATLPIRGRNQSAESDKEKSEKPSQPEVDMHNRRMTTDGEGSPAQQPNSPSTSSSSSSSTTTRQPSTGGKLSFVEPASFGKVASILMMHACKKILLINTSHLLLFNMALIFFVSLVTDHFPVPRSFFSNKRNFLNVYFVKFGWGWTSGIVGLFIYLTSHTYCCGRYRSINRHLLRLLVSTVWWYISVSIFDLIHSSYGMCSLSSSSNSTEPPVTRSTCEGHAFLLMHCLLVISEEARSVGNGWVTMVKAIEKEESTGRLEAEKAAVAKESHETNSTKIRWLALVITFLALLWEMMLVATVLYFHNMPQKFIGALFAVLGWLLTYRSWYRFDSWWSPRMPGVGDFKYLRD